MGMTYVRRLWWLATSSCQPNYSADPGGGLVRAPGSGRDSNRYNSSQSLYGWMNKEARSPNWVQNQLQLKKTKPAWKEDILEGPKEDSTEDLAPPHMDHTPLILGAHLKIQNEAMSLPHRRHLRSHLTPCLSPTLKGISWLSGCNPSPLCSHFKFE